MLVAAADCSFLRGEGTGAPELLSAFMNPLVANWRERRKLFIVALNKAHFIPSPPPHPIWIQLGQGSRHVL